MQMQLEIIYLKDASIFFMRPTVFKIWLIEILMTKWGQMSHWGHRSKICEDPIDTGYRRLICDINQDHRSLP